MSISVISYTWKYVFSCISFIGAIVNGVLSKKRTEENMDKVMNIASYICEEYRKISGEAIDEMKLHKLLYLSQRESLAIGG